MGLRVLPPNGLGYWDGGCVDEFGYDRAVEGEGESVLAFASGL